MAKGDFYFPLFYKRLLTSTIGWKDDEFGAYVRLLIHQFDNGSIPSDLKELSRIAPSIKKHWPLIKKKFKDDGNGGMINHVMYDIYHDIQEKKKINSDNGKKGGRKRTVNRNESDRLPIGSENETQTEAIPITNNKQQITKEGNTDTHPPENFWMTKPGRESINLELPELKAGAVQELFGISKNLSVSLPQIEKLWMVFKIQNFNGEKFYQTANETFSHFINWCKTQDVKSIEALKSTTSVRELGTKEKLKAIHGTQEQ